MIGIDPSIADALAQAAAEAVARAGVPGLGIPQDHVVFEDGARGDWYLYRIEDDGAVAQGEDPLRARRMSRAAAEHIARRLGGRWRARRAA
jgi:hypothetical protein